MHTLLPALQRRCGPLSELSGAWGPTLSPSVSLSFRIGFLGLGLMGSGIVSNLLKMGHTVTVWNRTAEKVSICGGACQVGWDNTLTLGDGVA